MPLVLQWYCKMKKLTAITKIKHGGKTYKKGESLQVDAKDAEFLLKGGHAFDSEATKEVPKPTKKAEK